MENKKRLIPIIAVIAIGIAVGGLILTLDKTQPASTESTADAEAEATGVQEPGGTRGSPGGETGSQYREGSKGGKLFTADGFGLEVTIFEKGVPPQFRLYLYENGEPLPPSAAKVTVTLSRLGAPAQVYKFKPQADYLVGDQIVEEPHSFDVAIAAERKDKTFHWKYSQVEGRVTMPDEMLKSIGVEILTAGPAIIKPTLKLPGEIIFNEHTIVQVVPRLPGIVTSVERHHGQQVKKGEVLAVIESQMLAELRSQYRVARKRLALAQTTYEREKRLWEEKISAKQDYLVAQTLWNEAEIALDLASVKLRALGVQPESGSHGNNLARYEIRAPISGLITEKSIALGQTLKEDNNIFTIADVSTVWTAITVYPKDIAAVKIGQKATVKATASDIKGKGTVTYITALVGGQTRNATARIELENKDGRWLPGMFVNAELVAEEIQVPAAVSTTAIQTVNDWTVVFGRYGQYFEVRPLELGRSDGNMVEVLEGFRAGEQYAGGNSFAIKAELGKSGATHDH
ncbi:efflux RND transporter periplasmic adaptor subunit [Nitrosovibrio sp. Nv4]|uniref:efflux RND transporter periplasmic adaptor subunit n=1 Tax=Nitrosovibrio sp. Nv4 TaxID=1945880 RepID=UPI000BC89EC1|nr:efflux RND transporter periplasmic adaptor subunit [Nitrosovibrio sp. Nv4]SOD42487.1 membrane fusion protein, cobalt-zinc-cadmium efflux system [Nitrosovibrio sp. Nv4]